ncbi:hypothetical protein KW786_02585, partial [Candidatus Parcubacteria bacterium]|nr:hypothetical protein [Candidatus Parcubacteria bacterium]
MSIFSSMRSDIIFNLGKRRFSFQPWLMFQGLALLSVFLILCVSIGTIFSINPGINSRLVIKDAVYVQMPTVAGDVVHWSVIVKRSDIQGKQRFLKLPKNAKNITVKKAGQAGVNRILAMADMKAQSPLYRLAFQNKKILAKGDSQTNLFDIVAEPAGEVPASTDEEVVSSSQNRFIDLSKQAAAEEETPAPDVITPDAPPAPIEETPPPAAADEAPAPETPAPSEPSSDVSTPPAESLAPSVSDETPAPAPIEETPAPADEDSVVVTFVTPAVQMTDVATDEGKRVTVSVADDSGQPVTDVLAFTPIPEIYKVGQKSRIKITWQNEAGEAVPFDAFDTNGNGKIDLLQWNVRHLSEQTFNIIFISKAFQLDENKEIYADIYDQVWRQDIEYASVPANQYIRVTFEKILDNRNDITLYAKSMTDASVDVYPVYDDGSGNLTEGPMLVPVSDGESPMFDHIADYGKYRILLSNLATPTDVFDLRINSNAINVDFIVDPSSGPNNAGTGADDSGIGTIAWTNPGNVTASDDSYATASTFGSGTTHYLKATNFGFSIPDGSTINGIKVEWEHNASNMISIITDHAVRIVKGGTIGSTDKSSVTRWAVMDEFFSYGSSSDLWGETWTAADINSSTFGAALSADFDSGGPVNVDSVRITITYTAAGSSIGGTVYTDEGSTNIGANKTVAISINGAAAAATDDTDASGVYSITGLTISANDVLTLYIDDETEDGVTVTKATGSDQTGVNIYQNDLITRCDNSCSLSNANLNTPL